MVSIRRVAPRATRALSVLVSFGAFIGLSGRPAVAQPVVTITPLANVREPYGGVIRGSDGALYGTSRTGPGSTNCGYVFRLDPQSGGTFGLTILHEFAGAPTDGCEPHGELVEGPDGALYGTTRHGGPNVDVYRATRGTGTIFRIAKSGGPLTMSRPFAGMDSQFRWVEGYGPIAGLTLGPDGTFYGTTSVGGSGDQNAPPPGTVFRFTPAGELQVLYSFGVYPANDHSPQDALTLIDGNLYGTMTATGGSDGAGGLFRVSLSGVVSRVFTLPFNQCLTSSDCWSFGANPLGAPTAAADAIYIQGYSYGAPPGGYGSVVRVNADGTGTLVHAFSGGADGGSPHRALTLGADGYLYGLTTAVNQTGPTIFRLGTDGSTFQTLHEFATGGAGLQGRLLEISPGEFIGTSASGGAAGGFVFRLSVQDANQGPVATDSTATTAEDTPVSGQLGASDADNDPLTFAVVSNGTTGTVTITDAATGAFTYTPQPNAAGTDTFTFTASDGTSISNVATVTVTIDAVNDAPTATDSAFPASEDAPFSATLQASDVESNPLVYSIVTNGSKGTATIVNAGTGTFTYTPAANATGGDSFTFKVNDGTADSRVATVTVTIAAVNDAPTAQSGVVTTAEGAAVTATLQAGDIDSTGLTFSIAAQPAQGSVSMTDASTGAFTYTPNPGVTGYDPFTFAVSDGTSVATGTEMVFVVASSPRWPGQTVRASVASDGTPGNRESFQLSLSADGRYAAFYSWASNLVAGDTNGMADVFVHDRQTGETRRVSVTSDGTEGNGVSYQPSLSADGRYVAFRSDASNLVAGDTNGTYDVFVHDRETGQTVRASVASDGTEGNGVSYQPSLSADGRYVAFHSDASNLVAGDINGTADVFVHDRQTGETRRVSVASSGTPGNDYSFEPSLSADGSYVVFSSFASNLVAGDSNSRADVFVHDRQTGETRRLSVASDGTQGNGDSYQPSLSAGGRYVAFISLASTLVAGDTNFTPDVFVHDRQTGDTRRVSVASDGAEGNRDSYQTSLSADGRYVAFRSLASNLVLGDTNGTHDVFVHDRQTGETRRVSVASDGTQGNGHSYEPSLSADGRFAAFTSYATNLMADDINGSVDVFVVGGAPLPSVPAATDDAITTPEDAPASGVLHATDPNGAPLTFAIVSSGALGRATLTNTATGAYTYTPNPDANGTDTFTFQASNGSATSNVATVTVTITPVNDGPVASNGTLTVVEDTTGSGTLAASDVDSANLTFALVANGSKGTATITNAATGAFTYSPNGNATGTDTFTFKAGDGALESNIATVTVTIEGQNDAPIAANGTLTVTEDSPGSGALSAVDVDADALTYAIVSNGTKGRVTIANPSTGTFTYTPLRNATGADVFTFAASDGSAQSNAATVSVTIMPVNDAPVAHGQSLFVLEDSAKSIIVAGSDADNDQLTFILLDGPGHGTLSGALPAVVYTPDANYNGLDSFSFKVNDGTSDSAVARVTLDVSPLVWTSYGPEGGAVTAVAVDPRLSAVVYAGTQGGMFKSTDGGTSWRPSGQGLTPPTPWILTVAIDPLTPTTVYAGTLGGGLFKSTDGGTTWTGSNTGLSDSVVLAIAVNPLSPTTLYAGTANRLFKTTNGGATWSATSASVPAQMSAIAIDPSTPTTLYASSQGGGVIKSTDEGSTWSSVNSGLANLAVYSLAINAMTPSTVFAATEGGVFKTTNGGASWTLTGSSTVRALALAIDPLTPETVYAGHQNGLLKTTNGGTDWLAPTTMTERVAAIAIDPGKPSTLLAGTFTGLYRSTTSGASWAAQNTGLSNVTVDALAYDPSTPSTLYAGGNGIFRSVNAGITWTGNLAPSNYSVFALAVDPTAPTTLYAGTNGGVLKSTNGGTSWGPTAVSGPFGFSLAVHPVAQGTVYVGTAQGVFRSTNGGVSWTAASAGLSNLTVRALAIDPLTPTTMYAGTDAGVFKSTDGALTWVASSNGLMGWGVSVLTIDPATPNVIYSGGGGSLFKSTDGGANWSERLFTNYLIRGIALDPATPTSVYAVSQGRGVFRSSDAGTTWKPITTGMSTPNVRSIVVVPGTETTPYAGTEGAGVFRMSRAANDPPVAGDLLVTTSQGTSKPVVLTASDPDGEPLTFTIVASPSHGGLSGTAPNLVYTPTANYSGPDTFTYKASDGSGDSNIATAAITVTANQAPVASAGSMTANEDVAANGWLVATDQDGQTLTYSIVTNGTKGIVTITNAATGAFTYMPNANANGTDSFTFKVNDGVLDSNVATVTVTITAVNDAPVAQNGSNTTFTGSSASGTLLATDVESVSLTYAIVTNGTKGTATLTNAATGAYTYAANAGTSGTDSFTFKANDGGLDSNVATITITIVSNRPPVASNGSLTTQEDRSANGTLSATDPDGNRLTFSIVSVPSRGTATITNAATGRFTYVPDTDANGTDTFTFKVNDGTNDSNLATVTVTITAVNDLPVAAGASYTIARNTALNATLAGTDVDGDPLTFVIARDPRRGTITNFNPATGAFTYTPRAGFVGTDSFTFKVSDGTGTSTSATVSIVVN